MNTHNLKRLAAALAAAAAIALPAVGYAASGTGSAAASADGLFSCFDAYRFGSVQVALSSATGQASAGTATIVAVKAVNQNSYPIVDGAVYVKVERVQSDAAAEHANGGDVVDQFYALDHVSLAANGSYQGSFAWKIPAGAVSGDYQIIPYFVSSHQFNLLGLSFTDDIHGQPLDLMVGGGSTGAISFDKNSVTVGGALYRFASFTPKFSASEPVTVSASLSNNGSKAETIPVIAHVYKWDAASDANHIADHAVLVSLKPGEKKTVSFSIAEAEPVVYTVIEAADPAAGGAKSILDVRFSRDGLAYPRINFPASLTYPLRAGEQASLFSCMHSVGTVDSISNGKLVLTVADPSGNVIDTYTYNGVITGAMMGVRRSFVPLQSYSDFDLHADIYQNGSLVGSTTIPYRCADIDPSLCAASTGGSAPSGIPYEQMAITAGLLAIAIMALALMSRGSIGRALGSIIIVVCFAGAAATIYLYAHAAASDQVTLSVPPNGVTWSGQFDPGSTNYVDVNYGGGRKSGTVHGYAVMNPFSVSVAYGGTMKNAATGATINPGDSVPVGTKIAFSPAPFDDTNISWFATGYTNDSPYGYWTGAGGGAVPACSPSDFLLTFPVDKIDPDTGRTICANGQINTKGTCPIAGTTDWVYTPLSIATPSVSIAERGTASLLKNADGSYTVTSAGTIVTDLVFSQTTGTVTGQRINTPIRTSSTSVPSGPAGCFGTGFGYSFSVPQQTVTLSASATAPAAPTNQPPVTPTIDGPSTATTGVSAAYGVTATDPNGDALSYSIVFDPSTTPGANTAADMVLPSSGTVASGTRLSFSKAWPTAGAKTIWARATDSNGASSTWTSYNVSVSDPAPQPPVSYKLSVSFSGAGSGSVSSAPSGVSCSSGANGCSASFTSGTAVILSASAATGSTFSGWSGAGCSGTGDCVVTMTSDQSATAAFATVPPPQPPQQQCVGSSCSNNSNTTPTPVSRILSVSVTGPGVVSSDPAGIDQCGTSCSSSFSDGTSVTLIASSTAGNSFVGWDGACVGSGSCTVTLSADSSVHATFSAAPAKCVGSACAPVNNAPLTPTISGPQQARSNTPTSWSIVSTDPEGDPISYNILVNSGATPLQDAAPDMVLPSSGTVPSGTSLSFSETWPDSNALKTIWGQAVDSHGNKSAWGGMVVKVGIPNIKFGEF